MPTPPHIAIPLAFAVVTAAMFQPGAARADELIAAGFIEDTGNAERVNYSGKLRMLSQRIPAAACNEQAGIATEAAAKVLAGAVAEYDRIIAALEFGDDGLGIIGPETDRKILKDIQDLHAVWDPMHGALDRMIAGDLSRDDMVAIANKEDSLLQIAKHLVFLITGEYADPTSMMQADSMLIDIAGRQRMLAQRTSKATCLVLEGVSPETSMKTLHGASETYETSMYALRNGLPEAGIKAPPTEEIAAGLDEVVAGWVAMKPLLDIVKDGGTLSVDQREAIFHGMNAQTGMMNTLVGKYVEASKFDY
ncbi:type IV pili methyl-accepting chemotaxis transducer N-terminal domain-containing protein [Jannaschia aquimarina]|uniref:NarX-like N-terminal domain-containing protein n=1 Tax=Jannaschia aquimarina TaxID=935700 RepID=A0A0D1EHM6_9RHOB|nr:type IV pili methyl-accepting chemotaxis transducer N-terminal domain-containing protein [Jannaschia aquimarina]KIT16361.1 hypothetical protein jaqu_19570 [Jannaschia aquimarina]SNT25597.1 Type IV pili methyl-accepting chemotaxis transducer N-term [Jannaschia aquimarina]